MKFFIIGPTGSIGQELVPTLVARGHEVVGLTRSQANADRLMALGGRPVRGEIAQPEVWQNEAAQADGLINLGSVPTQRGDMGWAKKFTALNTAAYQGLLDAAEIGGRCQAFVAASGAHMAGDHGDDWIDEDTPPQPHPITNIWGRWLYGYAMIQYR